MYKRGTTGSMNSGYEPYAENMATQVSEALGISHVAYLVAKFRGKLASKCKLMTDENISLIPLYLYIGSSSPAEIVGFVMDNNIYIDFYNMLLLDYIILNTDRHLGNFGVLVDSDTFELISLAPIYDNGMSCLHRYRADAYRGIYEYMGIYNKEYEKLNYFNVLDNLKYSGIVSNIRSLLQFRFDRNRLLDCPDEHIDIVEWFVRKRARDLLSNF